MTHSDPPGELRLEGQVLTEDDLPVGGAIVSVSSKPERQVRTEPDGSFSADGLISKQYRLTARKAELIGGPVLHQLSADSPPAIVRVRQGHLSLPGFPFRPPTG